jgi:hypothetical protein
MTQALGRPPALAGAGLTGLRMLVVPGIGLGAAFFLAQKQFIQEIATTGLKG